MKEVSGSEREGKRHVPVLLHEVIDNLNLRPGAVFVDCTLGGGGHTEEVCRQYENIIKIIGIDQDSGALLRAKEHFSSISCDISFYGKNFREIDKVLLEANVQNVNAILLDLGYSTDQIEVSGRGFSFQRDEPLLMNLNPENPLTAMKIVNEMSEQELADIIFEYGEERQARSIAHAIVVEREKKSITTTFELVEAVRKGYRGRYPRLIHFATKTFQALRIATNDELGALKDALEKGFTLLSPGGRIAAISFHSLEDRIVKTFMRTKKEEGTAILITKKPITPSTEEIIENRKARSAKLRILEKK